MKKIFTIAAMMVAVLSSNAQNEVGQVTLKPTVGVNIASMTKVGRSLLRVGVVAGVEAEVGVARNFSISAGALYSQQGVHLRSQESVGFILVSNNFDDYKDWSIRESTIKLDYINIPILAQFYPVKGLAIKAGVQLGVNVLKQVTLKGTIYYQERDSQPINGSYTINDGRDGVNSFYFSIPVGISYEYKNFVLDARYNIGPATAFKLQQHSHSVFSFTLGYKIAI